MTWQASSSRSAGQMVDRDRGLGQHGRVAVGVAGHRAANPCPGGGRRHRGQQRPRLEDGPIVAAAERGEVVHAPAMIEARLVRDPPHRPVLLDRGVLAELEAIAQ
jgi:hypothetical protein